jgi:hypothetical protein
MSNRLVHYFDDVTKGLIYRKFPIGSFSTWLYYLFVKIFVYCIIIVQIANKVGNKKKFPTAHGVHTGLKANIEPYWIAKCITVCNNSNTNVCIPIDSAVHLYASWRYACFIISRVPAYYGCWGWLLSLGDHTGEEKRFGVFEIELRKRDRFIDFSLPSRLLSEANGRCTALRSSSNNLSKLTLQWHESGFPLQRHALPSFELLIRP